MRDCTRARRTIIGLGLVTTIALSGAACAADPAPASTTATTVAGSGDGTGAGSATASATPTPTGPTVAERARTLAAGYDYAGAKKLLATDSSPAAKAELAAVTKAEAAATVWPDNGTISHIFYHSLIVDPKRAFAGDMAQGYADYMVTQREFTAQLAQLHERGYVLVHPTQIAAKGADGIMKYTPITLPPGKKPIVLSIDDTSYYEYMKDDGFASRLVVQPDGRVLTEYTDAQGKTTTGSHDVMPMVDDFVREHPDFSYRGAKGTMALTGYNGALGYRSSIRTYGDTPATRTAIAEAKVVADAMKKNGWLFASHSWGHISMTKSSLGRIEADAARWDAEVRPVVGDTPLLIFPFGADIAGVEKYTEANAKYRFLHEKEGFDYIFPIDSSTPHWSQLSGGSWRQARINVDGISLAAAAKPRGHVISTFFDAKGTVDPARKTL